MHRNRSRDRRAISPRRAVRHATRPVVQELEQRVLLAVPPLPINPTNGQQALLNAALKLATSTNPLGNFPVPYVLETQFGTAAPILSTPKAGQPTKIDIDQNKNTGQGGFDIKVEVNTVLTPKFHLAMDITRLGSAPFVQNFEVLISFPSAAFSPSSPPPPAAPNLFIGYRTTALNGAPGGIAPALEHIEFTPPLFLTGTNHLLDMSFSTFTSNNPLLFLVGGFLGDHLIGTKKSMGLAVHAQTPSGRTPGGINIGLDVNAAALGSTSPTTTVNLDWAANEVCQATLSYVEAEDFAVSDNDFATSLTFNQMPTLERFLFSFTPNQELVVSHRGNSVIDDLLFVHQRRDGTRFTVDAHQVPTEMDLSVAMSQFGDAAVKLDVNANTMDLKIEAIQPGGFPFTAKVLPVNVGYAFIRIDDAVDLTGGFVAHQQVINGFVNLNGDAFIDARDEGTIGGTHVHGGLLDLNSDGVITIADTGVLFGFNVFSGRLDMDRDGDSDDNDDGFLGGIFSARAVNPGESIKRFEIIADDDAHIDKNTDQLVGLQLPPSWNDVADHHVISIVEDGTHATIAARLLNFKQVVYDLNETDLTQALRLVTLQAAPAQLFLSFGEGSALLSGPNDDTEITCDIDDVPAGEVRFHFTPPMGIGYETIPVADIDSIHVFGHVGLTNFDLTVGGLPPLLAFNFDPAGAFSLVAEDGLGGPSSVDLLALRLFDTHLHFINGSLDINGDGVINGSDDGALFRYAISNGAIDLNGDGLFNGNDDGSLLGLTILNSRFDVAPVFGTIDGNDDLDLDSPDTLLSGAPVFPGRSLQDVRLRIDDCPSLEGTWGGVKALPFETSTGSATAGDVVMDIDTFATAVVREAPSPGPGLLHVARTQGGGFAKDGSVRALDSIDFNGQNAPFKVGDVIKDIVTNATATVRRISQLGGKGTLYISNRVGLFQDGHGILATEADTGAIILKANVAGGTHVSGGWTAQLSDDATDNGFDLRFGTTATDVFLGGVQVAISTAVELDTPLPAPTASSSQFVHITDLKHSLSDEPVPGRLSFGIFGVDDINFASIAGQLEAHVAADASHAGAITINNDFGGAFFPDKAIDLAVTILDAPQELDLKTDMATRFDYVASSAINSFTVVGVIDGKDDGLLNFRIRGGAIDLNGDGTIDAADSGLIGDRVVASGGLDINGDGAVNSADDGVVEGLTVIDGLIDVNDDAAITFRDAHDPNGTEVLIGLVTLPAEIHFKSGMDGVGVIGGMLDRDGSGEIDSDDDGFFGGLQVIDGKLDINDDAVIDNNDDGEIFDRPVTNGLVDLNGDGHADVSDDGQWSGLELHMSDQIQDLELLLRSQSDELGVLDGDNRIMHIQAHLLPANWLVASFGKGLDLTSDNANGFLFRTSDADGNPAAFGSISALIATTQDDDNIADLRKAFQQTQAGPEGAVLNNSGPSRINYSQYLQQIDASYYQAGDADLVLGRLASVYADGSILDTDNDHVAIRQAAGKALLTDIALHGFQQVSANWSVVFNPISAALGHIIDDVIVTLEAPTDGPHPLYFGLATSDGKANGDDDGIFVGRNIINGRVDVNGDGSIDSSDDGFVAGVKVIDGELDLNSDLTVDGSDDGMLRGVRVINGRLDVSERLVSLEVEDVPDHLFLLGNIEAGTITFHTSDEDDASASAGDIDFYMGTVTITPDDLQAVRARMFDTPSSVEITLNADLLNGGFNIDASDDFEARVLIQLPSEAGATRYVGGLHMEDIQIGYDVDVLSFDVAHTFDIVVGSSIINGQIDVDNSGNITNQDDGLSLDLKAIKNGLVDVDGDGDTDDADDGSVVLLQWTGVIPFPMILTVIDGKVDQTGNGEITNADDYDSTILSIPTAWDLFRATVGIDNNAADTEIAADNTKSDIKGFFGMYTLKNNPKPLDENVHNDTPAPRDSEYIPFISVALDEFRELSYSLALTLDVLTPNVVFPLSIEWVPDLSPDATAIFDFWVQDVEGFTAALDIPDELFDALEVAFPVLADTLHLLDGLTVGARFGQDYADNSPLHLFPLSTPLTLDNIKVETIDGILTLTEINLHLFGDHEDPFN